MLDLPGVALDVDTPDDLARAGLAALTRNRSRSAGRISSAAVPSPPPGKPRTSAAGTRSSLPSTRSAAAASSSATDTEVVRSSYPAGSTAPW